MVKKKLIIITLYVLISSIAFCQSDFKKTSLTRETPVIKDMSGTKTDETALPITHSPVTQTVIPDELKKEIKALIKGEIEKALGFINPIEILEKSEEYKDKLKDIETELDTKKAQLRSIQESAVKLKTELDTMGPVLSDDARARKNEELGNYEAQYRIKLQGAQEYAQHAEEKARMSIFQKIQREAEDLSQEEGRFITIAGGVIFGVKPIDLTEKVSIRLNKKYRMEKEKTEKKKTREESSKNKDQ